MLDWSDRHCRYLHRLFAPHALLYTEMLVAAALTHGNPDRLLAHDPAEHPVALQLGGCDPGELARAARLGEAAGFAEINLNVGCPSDRVRSGAFGACLMLNPELVGDCVAAMRAVVGIPVTVKCRIGIDARDDYEFLSQFVEVVCAAGVDALVVHARAAILGGLTPKENREIPALKYAHVQRLKRERPGLPVVINGGIADLDAVVEQRGAGLDGVMLGRAAYHRPELLAELDAALFGHARPVPAPADIIDRMVAYASRQAGDGVRLHAISRHMHGLMAGRAGARAWRRFLSEVASRPDARPETLFAALPILVPGLAA